MRALLTTFAVLSASLDAAAQTPSSAPEMYAAWCARCHAEDGSGRLQNPTVKTEPMDFTDCRVTSVEPDADWELVIARGGPAAGLSSEMPSFGDALQSEQIAALVTHIRSFCAEPGWPPGNLNFPLALFTEKAFPENELVIRPVVSHGGEVNRTTFRLKTVYERRIGRRAHVEVGVPFLSVHQAGSRASGLSDVSFAGKVALFWNEAATQILSAALEVTAPTGDVVQRLGRGTTVFEPYVSYGALLGAFYLQTQLKLELPKHDFCCVRDLVYNVYLGRDLSALPTTWTVGVEMNGEDREIAFTPQVRKGLTRTGALAAAVGVRIPAVARREQAIEWVGYLLWEYLEPVWPRR